MYKAMTTNLMVENVKDAMAFYQDMLGFSEVASVPNKEDGLQFTILTKDGLNLMLQQRTNLIEEYPILNTPKVQPSVSLYITVENFEDLYAGLKGKAKMLCDVHTTFYGAKEFAIADHDGYVITFTEHK